MTDLPQRLKDGTHTWHQTLEQAPLAGDLIQGSVSHWQYAAFLQALYSYLAAYEKQVLPELSHYQWGPYHYESRLPYLAADLGSLAQYTPTSVLPEPEVPQPRNLPQLLGQLYVIEGASQGGRIISPRLTRTLNLTPGTGLRYFHHFSEVRNQWPAFMGELKASSQHFSTSEVHESVARARAIFTGLTQYFTRCHSAWHDEEPTSE